MENEAVGSDAYLGDDGAFTEGWMDNLPDDTFEKDDTGTNKTGDLPDHKNIGSVVKSYMNSQKLLGTAIQPLKDDASDEERRAHFTKQGCPETVEGYEVKSPEIPEDSGIAFSEELLKVCTKYAHDNGIPKTVYEGLAKTLMDGQMAELKARVEANIKEQDKVAEEANNKLKGKWGADHDKFMEMARRSYDIHGGKEFVALMESSGLKDNAIVVETFLEIYKQTHAKEFVSDGTPPGKATKPGELVYDNSDM